MSFMIEAPTDSGDLDSGVDGEAADVATAVEPSLFGKCILLFFLVFTKYFLVNKTLVFLNHQELCTIFLFPLMLHRWKFQYFYFPNVCFLFFL